MPTRIALLVGCALAGAVGGCPRNYPIQEPIEKPVILSFTASAAGAAVGEPVTFSWSIADFDLDALTVTLSVDIENRPDYVISNAPASGSITHTYLNAGQMSARLQVDDGKSSVERRVGVAVSGPIAIDIRDPHGGKKISNDVLAIRVFVNPDYELESLSGSVADRSVTLSRGGVGQLDLTGLPSGPHLLTVRGRDVLGNEAEQLRGFVIDRPGTTTVIAPAAEAVVAQMLRVQVECADADSGGCSGTASLQARPNSEPVELGAFENVLDREVAVESFDGQAVQLNVVVARQAPSAVWFYVENSAKLTALQEVHGRVLHANRDQILVGTGGINANGEPPTRFSGLALMDRASGATTTVPTPANTSLWRDTARLVAGGVLYTPEVYKVGPLYWFDGSMQREIGSASAFKAAGHYAAWLEGATLKRHDFATQTMVEVASSALAEFDVAANGAVVFIEPGSYALTRWHAGKSTVLLQTSTEWFLAPVTDGSETVVAAYDRSGGTNGRLLLLDANGGVTELSDLSVDPWYAQYPAERYAIKNGWVAYVAPSPGRVFQVFRRSPQGAVEQVTQFSTASTVETLAPDGALLTRRGDRYDRRRYFSAPGVALTEIGGGHGNGLLIDGTLQVGLGRVLFGLNLP